MRLRFVFSVASSSSFFPASSLGCFGFVLVAFEFHSNQWQCKKQRSVAGHPHPQFSCFLLSVRLLGFLFAKFYNTELPPRRFMVLWQYIHVCHSVCHVPLLVVILLLPQNLRQIPPPPTTSVCLSAWFAIGFAACSTYCFWRLPFSMAFELCHAKCFKLFYL